jgi:hypothetical protein
MAPYASTFDAAPQETYDRTQVVIRIIVLIVLSLLGFALGWLSALLWLGVPVAAAVLISQHGAQQYLDEAETNMTKWLRLIVRLYAYIGLLTDRFPGEEADHPVSFSVAPAGTPTAGEVLLRIILVIPHAIVLALLGIVAGILLLIAAIMVLVQESYPESIFNFLRGYLRWETRVLVYLAGLTDEYPPFALDTDSEQRALPAGGPPPPM